MYLMSCIAEIRNASVSYFLYDVVWWRMNITNLNLLSSNKYVINIILGSIKDKKMSFV